METHAIRYESRDDLERGIQEMRSRGWVLWRVIGVPENALVAYFTRRSSPYPSACTEDAGRAERGDA